MPDSLETSLPPKKNPTLVPVQLLCQPRICFNIPDYQRGYRWTEREVEQLLKDLNESDLGYSLQPLVLSRRDNGWDVIDGQQRLTTIFLILEEFQFAETFQLRYSKYDGESINIVQGRESDDVSSIDLHHFTLARNAIISFLAEKGVNRDDFHGKVLSARFIWHDVGNDRSNATKAFLDINSAKIPLTSAELIKAVFLSEASSDEVAYQWDEIELQLRNEHFWDFITANSKYVRTIGARINFIFDYIAEVEEAGYSNSPLRAYFYYRELLKTYKEKKDHNFAKEWDRVIDIHHRLLDWFQCRETYHQIGFLQNVRAHGRKTIQNCLRQTESPGLGTKSQFRKWLNDECAKSLPQDEKALMGLNYDDHWGKLMDVLLWFNIQITPSEQRFEFLRYRRQGKWSLEHIHAQHAEPPTDDQEWKDYLAEIRVLIHGDPKLTELEDLCTQGENEKANLSDEAKQAHRREIIQAILRELDDDAGQATMHEISNLALLDSGTNSKLNNSPYALKRRKLFQAECGGAFIPLGTMHTFNKYYSISPSNNMTRWMQADRDGYTKAIVSKLPVMNTQEGL